MNNTIRLFGVLELFLSFISVSQATDWLMMQGTESPESTYKLWGFIQPSFTSDQGDSLRNLRGEAVKRNRELIANNTIAPWFNNQERFHLRRARLGLRGRLPLIGMDGHKGYSKNINYFILTEWGNNLITYRPFGDRHELVSLTDLSVTLNYIPGARIRIGLFKTPGPEELFQAIHVYDYIEFTDFVAREILERFVTGNLAPAPKGGRPTAFTTQGTPVNEGYGFNAGRDWGLQLFDRFKQGSWSLSYAAMIGNGDSISVSNLRFDNNLDYTFYLSSAYALTGGKGIFKHEIKTYAWYQGGVRNFSSDPENKTFDRKRYGFGIKALGELWGIKQRFSAELNFADGMLFVSPLGGVAGNPLRFAAEEGNKSRGVSIDYGIYPHQYLQFYIRYDRHDLLYEQAGSWTRQDERIIETITLGAQFIFTPKVRLTFNYLFRDAHAPHPSEIYSDPANAVITHNVKQTLKTLGDRIAVQFTWIF